MVTHINKRHELVATSYLLINGQVTHKKDQSNPSIHTTSKCKMSYCGVHLGLVVDLGSFHYSWFAFRCVCV